MMYSSDFLYTYCNTKVTEILMKEAHLAVLCVANVFLFSLLLNVVANRCLECLWVCVDVYCAAGSVDHL
jgi:hypothetical protein